ncbi:MAG: hypothetical protein IJH87_01995, partial [Atopobiaceae bacterium]|nr:hypothetical protein [Atopobiaceae bacterium]
MLPSLFFGFAMTFGYALQRTNGIGLLFHGYAQGVKTAASFIGWASVFHLSVDVLFSELDRFGTEEGDSSESVGEEPPVRLGMRLQRLFDDHPFAAPVCVLAIAWLPTVVGYAPGLFMGDTNTQIEMYFGLENFRSSMVDLLDPEVTMTSHFSVIHTVFLGACVDFGMRFLGSASAGFLVHTIIQTILTLVSLGYAFLALSRFRVPFPVRIACLVLFTVVPWYPGFSVLATRDTLFASALLVLCISILRLRFLGEGMLEWVLIAVSALLVAFLRNGGILFACVPLLLLGVISLKEGRTKTMRIALALSFATIAAF